MPNEQINENRAKFLRSRKTWELRQMILEMMDENTHIMSVEDATLHQLTLNYVRLVIQERQTMFLGKDIK